MAPLLKAGHSLVARSFSGEPFLNSPYLHLKPRCCSGDGDVRVRPLFVCSYGVLVAFVRWFVQCRTLNPELRNGAHPSDKNHIPDNLRWSAPLWQKRDITIRETPQETLHPSLGLGSCPGAACHHRRHAFFNILKRRRVNPAFRHATCDHTVRRNVHMMPEN